MTSWLRRLLCAEESAEVIEAKAKARRSRVRVLVTYAVTLAYCGSAVYLIARYAGSEKDRDLVLAAFAGLTGTASSVVGFWFGNRAAKAHKD